MTEPAFGGRCAFALSAGPAERAPMGKPDCTLDVNGETYAFAGAVPRWLFRVIPGSAARAKAHWDARG